jgi:hypothetical protein
VCVGTGKCVCLCPLGTALNRPTCHHAHTDAPAAPAARLPIAESARHLLGHAGLLSHVERLDGHGLLLASVHAAAVTGCVCVPPRLWCSTPCCTSCAAGRAVWCLSRLPLLVLVLGGCAVAALEPLLNQMAVSHTGVWQAHRDTACLSHATRCALNVVLVSGRKASGGLTRGLSSDATACASYHTIACHALGLAGKSSHLAHGITHQVVQTTCRAQSTDCSHAGRVFQSLICVSRPRAGVLWPHNHQDTQVSPGRSWLECRAGPRARNDEARGRPQQVAWPTCQGKICEQHALHVRRQLLMQHGVRVWRGTAVCALTNCCCWTA